MLGVRPFPGLSAAANALSTPPGEYDRKVETHFSPRNYPTIFPTIKREKKPQKKQKPYIVFDLLNLIQYMVSVADRFGIVSNFPILQEK